MTLTHTQQEQILTPPARHLMQLLAAEGEARIVGGAVRDAIVGRPIGDIDFASTLPPERAMELLARHDIKTVPTGLAHGTITAVIDGTGYEITTLRRDVATDGRHAQIEYTDDWRMDAARRDFTMNALYVDAAGKLYDYFTGIDDAQQGRVRFIGDAHDRIREDVLRILRFFRFHAFFGRGAPDAAALAACRDLADLIPRLSAERVMRETIKLLSAPNPLDAWRLMKDCGVTPHFLPEATNIPRLQALLDNEKQYDQPPAALARLAALVPEDEQSATRLAARLKFSNRDAEKLLAFIKALAALRAGMPLRHMLYAYGTEAAHGALLVDGTNIADALSVIAAWENPVFPIKGEDLLKTGLPPGPRIGEILREVEDWWKTRDFRPNRAACLEQAGKKM